MISINQRNSHGARARMLCAAALCLCLPVGCAEQPHSVPPAAHEGHEAPGPAQLEGYWEGDTDSGRVSMTFAANSLYFYARSDFQYDTTLVLVAGTKPLELHATILDSPRTTDSVGDLVIAIYEFDGEALKIAAIDKVDGKVASFERVISGYRLERAQPSE